MTIDQLETDLKARRFKPVYLLHGDESFYMDQAEELFESYVLQEHEKSFNLTIAYGKDSDARQIRDAASRFPMMSEYQLIIVREAQDMKDLPELANYAAQPVPSTILVLVHKHKKIDQRSKLAKQLVEKAVVFESKKIYDDQLPEFISGRLKQFGLKVDQEAANLMAEHLGNDLSKINNEIEKIRLNLPKGSTVDQSAVEKYVGISKEYNIFELQKALSNKQVKKAFTITQNFIENSRSQPLVLIIGQLFAYFSKVYMVHGLQGQSDESMAKSLGLGNKFFLREYKTAAQNYPKAKIETIFEMLRNYDLKSKGVGSDRFADPTILKEIIFKILS